MNLRLALLFWAAIFVQVFPLNASAQSLVVTGRVTGANNEPLQGATVSVKGTPIATTTNESGNYSITVPQRGSVLVVTYTGMQPRELTVTDGGPLNFSLSASAGNLDEVVVVGYGTQRVTKVSGSISTVKAADIEKLVPARAEEALQGKAAGVNVIHVDLRARNQLF